MKEQIKARKIALSEGDSQPIDAELETLVIRMLTEMVGYGHKIEEEVQAMQSEMKMYREPAVMGRKLGL